MRIAIDAPAVRSLSANEKMVYQMLKEGMTPREIAKKLRLALGDVTDLKYNSHDVMPDTVVNLITSIREKGWDIPTDNNKEEAEMPIAKLSEEAKHNIVTAFQAGATAAKLAEQYDVTKRAVYNVINAWRESGETALSGEIEIAEKEPVTVGAVTSSEQEKCDIIPADIVTPSEENVKTQHRFSPLVAEAIWRKVNELREEAIELMEHLTELEDVITHTEAEIKTTDEQITFVDAEIDRLIEDYEALTGGTI